MAKSWLKCDKTQQAKITSKRGRLFLRGLNNTALHVQYNKSWKSWDISQGRYYYKGDLENLYDWKKHKNNEVEINSEYDYIEKMLNTYSNTDEYKTQITRIDKPIEKTFVTFESIDGKDFTIKPGTLCVKLFASYDGNEWHSFKDTTKSKNGKIYIRSEHPDMSIKYGVQLTTKKNTSYNYNPTWEIKGSAIKVSGNIENLLDYTVVEHGKHPTMKAYCYNSLFENQNIVEAPELWGDNVPGSAYSDLFKGTKIKEVHLNKKVSSNSNATATVMAVPDDCQVFYDLED